MDDKIIHEKQDFTHLKWSKYRHSSGTAGSFLKAYESRNGVKVFYKLSAYDYVNGIYGHECVNEIIADRLCSVFDIDHVPYRLIHADVTVEDEVYDTYVCASDDFRANGEKKIAFDTFFEKSKKDDENAIDFCDRMGWRKTIDGMLLLDYLILNRDRHGANIEVLKDSKQKKIRLAPLYDHGLSLLFSCKNAEDVSKYDVMEDRRIQCFVGGDSAYDNLKLIRKKPIINALKPKDKEYLLHGLEDIIPKYLYEAIWKMIWERWKVYEGMQDL